MFFLIAHIFIGKYYPNVITQFIIGCICYVISFLIVRDIISIETYEQYKYYGLAMISIDTAYLVYTGKSQNSKKTVKSIIEHKIPIVNTTQNTIDVTSTKSNSAPTVTLSSEINDYRVKLFDSENITSHHSSGEKSISKNSNDSVISLENDSIFLASNDKNEISLSTLSKDSII